MNDHGLLTFADPARPTPPMMMSAPSALDQYVASALPLSAARQLAGLDPEAPLGQASQAPPSSNGLHWPRAWPLALLPMKGGQAILSARLKDLASRAETLRPGQPLPLNPDERSLAPTWAHGLGALLHGQVGLDSSDLDGDWWRLRRVELALLSALGWPETARDHRPCRGGVILAMRETGVRGTQGVVTTPHARTLRLGRLPRGYRPLGCLHPQTLLSLLHAREPEAVTVFSDTPGETGQRTLPLATLGLVCDPTWTPRPVNPQLNHNPAALRAWPPEAQTEPGAGSDAPTQVILRRKSDGAQLTVTCGENNYALNFSAADLIVAMEETAAPVNDVLETVFRRSRGTSGTITRTAIRLANNHLLQLNREGLNLKLTLIPSDLWITAPITESGAALAPEERLPWPTAEFAGPINLLDQLSHAVAEEPRARLRSDLTLLSAVCRAALAFHTDPAIRAQAGELARLHGLDLNVTPPQGRTLRLPLHGPQTPKGRPTVDAATAWRLEDLASELQAPVRVPAQVLWLLLAGDQNDLNTHSGLHRAEADAARLSLMPGRPLTLQRDPRPGYPIEKWTLGPGTTDPRAQTQLEEA